MLKFLLSVALLLFVSIASLRAQTTLAPGDLVFTGYISSGLNGGQADQFSFVLLKAISANTVIKFTDYGWRADGPYFYSGANNESELTFTANQSIPAGTELVYVSGATNVVNSSNTNVGAVVLSTGSVNVGSNLVTFSTGQLSLITSGDQLFAYQGSFTNPSFISGIHMNTYCIPCTGDPTNTTTTSWDNVPLSNSTYITSSTSTLPSTLTDGVNALWIGSIVGNTQLEYDNARFNCGSLNLGTVSAVQTAVNNKANWTTNDLNPPGFTLGSGCTFLSAPPTISVSGSLNSFSSCSGTASSFQSFIVSGSNLSSNLVVTAPSGFEVSTSSSTGYGSSLSLTPSSSNVPSTTIYVRLASTASGSPSGNVSCTSTGATTQNVFASGTVTPSVTPSLSLLIVSGSQNDCVGKSVTFLATASNGGSLPTYTFKVNNISQQSGFTNTYSASNFNNNDVVICELSNANNTCQTSSTASSSSITLTRFPLPSATISSNIASPITADDLKLIATPFNAAYTYVWQGNYTIPSLTDTAYLTNVNSSHSGVYTVTVTNSANNCSNTSTYNLSIAPRVVLPLKVFLSGAYVSAAGNMQDSLRSKSLIPLVEPYSTAPYNLVFTHLNGGGGESTTNAVLSAVGNNAIVDWVFLELRSSANSSLVLATKAALVQRDGDIVDASDGTSALVFANSSPATYFVSVRHRNHLGVMTQQAVSLGESSSVLDFSSSSTALHRNGTNNNNFAYSSTQDSCTRIFSGVRALYGGNCNLSTSGSAFKLVRYSGVNNDRTNLLSVAGVSGVVSGYYKEDLNMNGEVRYNGVSNDRLVLLQNVGTNVNNTIYEQLP